MGYLRRCGDGKLGRFGGKLAAMTDDCLPRCNPCGCTMPNMVLSGLTGDPCSNCNDTLVMFSAQSTSGDLCEWRFHGGEQNGFESAAWALRAWIFYSAASGSGNLVQAHEFAQNQIFVPAGEWAAIIHTDPLATDEEIHDEFIGLITGDIACVNGTIEAEHTFGGPTFVQRCNQPLTFTI